MKLYYDILMESGLNPEIVTSCINALQGTLILMLALVLFIGYMSYRAIKELPDDELEEEAINKTIEEVKRNYLGKRMSIIIFITYIFLFAADYLIINIL